MATKTIHLFMEKSEHFIISTASFDKKYMFPLYIKFKKEFAGNDKKFKCCVLNFKLPTVIEDIKVTSPFIYPNFVIFAKIKISNSSKCYNNTDYIYLVENLATEYKFGLDTDEIDLEITLLPFKPVQNEANSLLAMISNAILPITPKITTNLRYFPIISWLMNTQSLNFDPNFSKLSSLLPIREKVSDDSRQVILDYFRLFCEECGITFDCKDSLPTVEIKDQKDVDALLFFPKTVISSNVFCDCIEAVGHENYKLVSCLLESRGHYSTQVSSIIGNFDIYEEGVIDMKYPLHSIDYSKRKVVCLIYVNEKMFEYYRKLPFWPHPIVKNPKILNKRFPDNKIFKDTGEKGLYINYNKRSLLYSSIPSKYARSDEVFVLHSIRKRGQIVWRVPSEKEPFPVYVEDSELKAKDICRIVSGSEEGVALVQVRGNAGLHLFRNDQQIQFPIESLIVVDIINKADPSDKSTAGGLVLASYAKIKDTTYKYTIPPRVFYVNKLNKIDQYKINECDYVTIYCDTRLDSLSKMSNSFPVLDQVNMSEGYYPILVVLDQN